MPNLLANPQLSVSVRQRAAELFRQHQRQIFETTDRMFAVLMVIQWLASIAAAYWISPYTWSGPESHVHIHVWAAWLLGGTITAAPVAFALLLPGRAITRHVVAVAQMLTSALLIHLTGGRIETHFHVFGSLAFLAFYRDWKVLITASVVVAADHLLRGFFWPQSGLWRAQRTWWRSMEHAGWVVFEDVILVRWCFLGIREMQAIALRTAELENTNERVEQTVVERTAELRVSEARLATRERSRRGRQPRQKRISGQHEPRNSHAAQRHRRNDGIGARHPPDAVSSKNTSVPSNRVPTRCSQ